MFLILQYLSTILVLLLTARWLLRKLKIGNYGNRYVFITGCDSGFGNLLTKRLDELGFYVFAGCLTEKGCQSLKTECSKRVTSLLLDVSDENSVRNVREQVEASLPENKGLWAIVNNAGIAGGIGHIEWQTNETIRRTLGVNLFGVIYVTKEFLPLVRREKGRIVNTASVAGRFAFPPIDYCTSKYGVEGFSDKLRRDMYRTGVSVHIIEPGYFQTNLFDKKETFKLYLTKFHEASEEVKQFYGEEYAQTVTENSLKGLDMFVSPHAYKVVDAYQHAIIAKFPKIRYVVGWDANIVFRFLWNLPEWLSDYIVCKDDPVPAGAK